MLGLFGSPEWWNNIVQRKMPLRLISGIIQSAYVAGQDKSETINNSIDLRLDNGSIMTEGIYVNNADNVKLFRASHRVEVVYALDEAKRQPAQDGSINYSDIVLEMAVSLKPVE